MQVPSRKPTSKWSFLQGALRGGTLCIFHTLHPGVRQGSPFQHLGSLIFSLSKTLNSAFSLGELFGARPLVALPHAFSMVFRLRENLMRLIIPVGVPNTGALRKRRFLLRFHAPKAAHHQLAGCPEDKGHGG